MYFTDFLFKEIKDILIGNNLSPNRAYQIFNWIYRKFVFDFSEMSDISKKEREFLNENFNILSLELVESINGDDTIKFLFKTKDENFIETVLIIAPKNEDNERLTLCISSQAGCPLDCEFCATGKIGFKRNLSVSEIISQLLLVEKFILLNLKEFKPLGENLRHIGNIVFMGMGEPLLNTENVLKVINILTFSGGYNIGERHITISTAGIIPEIERFLNSQIRLAISLHTPFQEIREQIMPVAKKYKLPELIDAIKYYQNITERRITFEYILINELNDSEKDVIELKKLLSGLKYNLNLINYNPIPQSNFKPLSEEKIKNFTSLLDKHSIPYVLRKSKGSKLYAGCGQLGLLKLKNS
ncbi:MAG: 23S rRNA (adenine(2503)-C(2))-methyltransferase RlmN [Brevinematales bacterium]|nr:23S rRNA (adenine(2503)-C(2))-methyltransferase RlmN [Brevinematales bacterium]